MKKLSKEEFVNVLEILIKYNVTHIGADQHYQFLLDQDFGLIKYKTITVLYVTLPNDGFFLCFDNKNWYFDVRQDQYTIYYFNTFEKYLKFRAFI